MTVPVLRIKVLPKPTIRGKMDVRFPANVSGRIGVVLEKIAGHYYFDIDYSQFGEIATIPDYLEQTTYFLTWESGANAFSRISVTSLKADITATFDNQYQPLDPTLTALAGLDATPGLLVQTGEDIFVRRSLVAPASGLTITNPAGTAGDPTFALSNDLAGVEALSGTGIARRTGPDAWSVGTAVANAELAAMTTGTIKGNVSGSTATPSDLTATQVTAALNAMVGDSGAGGSKGLVPAPSAGDAASGKYLKADGSWQVPPGGGSVADSRPSIIAHAGYMGSQPLDTLRAIRYAIASSRQLHFAVEIDVRLTSDGVPILFHDDTLDSVTDGSGPVASASLATIQGLTIDAPGIPISGIPATDLKIPTLADAVALFRKTGTKFTIDIKASANGDISAIYSVISAASALDLVESWNCNDISALGYVRSLTSDARIIYYGAASNESAINAAIDAVSGLGGRTGYALTVTDLVAFPAVVAHAAGKNVELQTYGISTAAQAAASIAAGVPLFAADNPIYLGQLAGNVADVPEIDGWISAGHTLTYVSASSFSVPGDQRERYVKGLKLRFDQTARKYFYVTGSSYGSGVTTVTVTGGSDYSLANAAIDRPYYSRTEGPAGFPDWFNHNPVYTGFSAAPSPSFSKFRMTGNLVQWINRDNTDGTSNSAEFKISLPVSPARSGNNSQWSTFCGVKDNGTTLSVPGVAVVADGSTTVQLGTSNSAINNFTGSGAKKVAYFNIFYEI